MTTEQKTQKKELRLREALEEDRRMELHAIARLARRECPWCDGGGYVDASKRSTENIERGQFFDCSNCNGTGRVE